MAQHDALDFIFELTRGFMASRVFTTAAKLDLFTVLQQQPEGMTLAEISQAIGLCQDPNFRGAQDFLDCLVSLKALERQGEGTSARYSSIPELAPYLVKGGEEYIGGIMLLNQERSYWHFGYLEHALKTGESPDLSVHGLVDPVALFAGQQNAAVAFAHGMTGASLGAFRAFARGFDFKPYKTLGDFGGSLAVLCICVAQVHSHMCCTSYDLATIHKAAEENVAEHGVSDRVELEDFDFFSDSPFPSHDVITMSMILHDWGAAKKKALITKAFHALPKGGSFVAIDNVIDNERRKNTQGFMVSLNMLLEFGKENSCEYTFKEFQDWTSEIGFSSASCMHLHGSKYACIAVK